MTAGTWKALENRFKGDVRVVLKEHDGDYTIVPRYRLEIIQNGRSEGQAFDKLDPAVAAFDELMVELGIIDRVVLPPETADEVYATWQFKLRQTKGLDDIARLEDEMMDDPQVRHFAPELLERVGANRAVSASVIRRVAETLLEEARLHDLKAVSSVSGFGRFG